MNKYALFGGGYYGKKALWEYGNENIACFIDNNVEKHGTMIEGIPVVGLEEYKDSYSDCPIIISTKAVREISAQLDENGITNYSLYLPKVQYYYPPDKLIENPYKIREEAIDEHDWNAKACKDTGIDYINQCVEVLNKSVPLFNHVEIETYNRCNGVCEFCPVSVKNETRSEKKMSEVLFYKIIDNLSSLDYDGKIALFSNNEPFLDDRIIDFQKYARIRLPKARFHLYTNGTKLGLDEFVEMMEYLDELIIDNYNQQLELIPPVRKIKEYCESHTELIERVTIILRKPREILTSRGGSAPNRKEYVSYDKDSCMLPFRQIIIRPDGKVSLCCNDPLGRNTMGDVNDERLEEIWYGKSFTEIRTKLLHGRGYLESCKNCDAFIIA